MPATDVSQTSDGRQIAALGGRLLQRIQNPSTRLQECRSYLQEIATLGADAPAQLPDLTPEEARPLVIQALAEAAPEQGPRPSQAVEPQRPGRRARARATRPLPRETGQGRHGRPGPL